MEVNHFKADTVLRLGDIDILKVLEKLNKLQISDWDTNEDFVINYNKGNKKALRSTQHITLKFSNKQSNPFQYITLSRWEDWKPLLMPIMEKVVSHYNYQKGCFPRVMFANLPSKCIIAPHTDGDEKGSIPHKIHIPLVTNDRCYFFIEEKRHFLEQGVAYEVNNSKKHGVANGGNSDRIHLIFEYLDFNAQTIEIQQQILKGEGI
jgi:hypothetical protein